MTINCTANPRLNPRAAPHQQSAQCAIEPSGRFAKTLAELSSEFGVHPTMISTWKQELLKRATELFARGNKAPAVGDAQKVIDDLHRKSASCRSNAALPSSILTPSNRRRACFRQIFRRDMLAGADALAVAAIRGRG
jgi:hypothetical protein